MGETRFPRYERDTWPSEELLRRLPAISYKPSFDIQWIVQGPWSLALEIRFTLPDSDVEGFPLLADSSWTTVTVSELEGLHRSPMALKEWVRMRVQDFELHEMDEFLRVGGLLVRPQHGKTNDFVPRKVQQRGGNE